MAAPAEVSLWTALSGSGISDHNNSVSTGTTFVWFGSHVLRGADAYHARARIVRAAAGCASLSGLSKEHDTQRGLSRSGKQLLARHLLHNPGAKESVHSTAPANRPHEWHEKHATDYLRYERCRIRQQGGEYSCEPAVRLDASG